MANALDNLVSSIRSLCASGNIKELASHLHDLRDVLSKNVNILDNMLETLNMKQHSLGVLYILYVKFSSSAKENVDAVAMYTLFKDFIEQCNIYHIRVAIHIYYDICHIIANKLVEQDDCKYSLKTFAIAAAKGRRCRSQLTPVHTDLCMLSLKSKHFKYALGYLQIDMTTISTGSETRPNYCDPNVDSKYILAYYYYGGMVYTTIKRFERALYFFEVCLSTPAVALSCIMLEAYKKFILVSLIVYGKVLPLQKHTSQIVSRFIKPMSHIYHTLAAAYVSSSDELQMVMFKYKDTFVHDRNYGLVKQVAYSLYKRKIQRLTQTFLTLSLSDMASRVQLGSAAIAERYILKMIKSHEIHATINQKDGMVAFMDPPQKYNTPQMFRRLQKNMKNIIFLIKQINHMEEEISLNPEYLKKVLGSLDVEIAQISRGHAGERMD